MLESKKEEQKWRVITQIFKDLNLPFMLVKTCKTFFFKKSIDSIVDLGITQIVGGYFNFIIKMCYFRKSICESTHYFRMLR